MDPGAEMIELNGDMRFSDQTSTGNMSMTSSSFSATAPVSK